ncbi:MAG: lipoyl domain-containing protein [Bacteroidota bacterium]
MLKKLFKIFSGDEPTDESSDGETYFDYDNEQIDEHKEEFGGRFMEEILVPRLTDKDITYEVSSWFKKEGEQVSSGESICQLTSKRSIIEIDVEHSGYVYFRQKPKKPVRPGAILCVILSGSLD